jgi:hypothetical protein
MGILYRKRAKLGKNSWANVSKTGASLSTRVGPFTVNTRGRVTVRLGNGLSWRLFR